MSEWKECKLGEHVFINSLSVDKNYPYKEIEYLDTGSITRGKIESLQCLKLADAPSRAKRIVKDNDIVLSMVRPIQRHYGYLRNTKPNTVVSTGFVVLTNKESIDPYFLYSFLTQDDTTEYLDVVAEGSTSAYPAFTPDVVENLSILLPPLPEQRAIAGVLSSLDDKIDLLRRQNETLEGMAEAVYRRFFVEGRTADWKECTVNELAKHEKQSINPNRNPETLFYHYSIPAFDESHMPIPELGTLIQSNKYKVLRNTILFSKLNPHKDKRVWLIPSSIAEDSISSTEFQVINPKSEKYLFFLYGFISYPENYGEIAAGVGGTSSSHQRIDPEVIFKFPCFTPDDGILANYNEIVGSIFGKMHCNLKSIQTLSRLRDTLLPKLMSGEMRVKV